MGVRIAAFLLLMLSFSSTVVGQRMPFFTHHITNPYLYNPAFAGYDAHPVLYLTYRQQWLGIEGAPSSANLSFHTPTGNANPLSIGADLTHDRLGIFQTSAFRATAAYLVPLSAEKEHYVRFGLSAGIGLDGYDLSSVNSSDDAIFQAAQNAGAYLRGRFGLQYHYSGFNLGLSIPELFEPPSFSDPTSTGGIGQFDRAIASLNYKFTLGARVFLEPTLLYHYATQLEPQAEALALLRIGSSFWVGGGYQQQAGIASLIGFQTKSFKFGYHYGLGGNDLAPNSFGTHEVQLALVLGKKRATMRRKPRLTTKKDSEAIPEAVIEAQRKKEKEKKKADKKRPEPTPSRKQVQPVDNQNTVNPPTSTGTESTKTQRQQKIETKTSVKQPNVASQPNQKEPTDLENITFEEIDNSSSGTVTLGKEKPQEPRFAKAKRKQSNHPLEMEEGVYLIAGTFSQRPNAEKLARQLSSKGYTASVGYNSDKKYFYTSIMKSDNADNIRSRIHQIRKDPQFSKAWILVIE
ncbi:MAG: PorP/SprF family type IX secretion system membrane protein [Bacteroidota bacterium]